MLFVLRPRLEILYRVPVCLQGKSTSEDPQGEEAVQVLPALKDIKVTMACVSVVLPALPQAGRALLVTVATPG